MAKRIIFNPSWRATLTEWGQTLVVFFVLTVCIGQAYVIPTGSMEGTLLIGDHVLVDKLGFGPPLSWISDHAPRRSIEHGQVVVFRYPLDERENYVKRVIGLPGDRVHIEDRQVVVNGRALVEPYKRHISGVLAPYRDNFPMGPVERLPERAKRMIAENVSDGEIVVPAGSYFVLGDNRDNSLDSRYWGFVPRENIVGRPMFVYWSYSTTTERLEDWVNVDHLADIAANFFTKTRWERTFRPVNSAP